jgi:hypothetical protein
MTDQTLVQALVRSFPHIHDELTFWFRLVHVIYHSRRRDVKVMRCFGTSQSQIN